MKNNFTSSKKPKIGFVALLLFFCVLWGNDAMAQVTNTNFFWGGGISNSWGTAGNWSTTGRYVHTANYTSGSTTVTIVTANLQGPAPTTVLAVGHAIVGPGIPANTTVAGTIVTPANGTTITLSQPTTADGSAAVIQTYLKATFLPFATTGTATAGTTATAVIDNAAILSPVVSTTPNVSIVLMRNSFGPTTGPTLTINPSSSLTVTNFSASPFSLAGGNVVNNGTLNITSNSTGASTGFLCILPTVLPLSPTEYSYSGAGNLNINISASTTANSAAINVTSLNANTTYKMLINSATTTFNLGGSTATSFAFRNVGGALSSSLIIGGTGISIPTTNGGLLSVGSQSKVTVNSGTTLTLNSASTNLTPCITAANSANNVPTEFSNKGTINILGSSSRSGIQFSTFGGSQGPPNVQSPNASIINFTNEGIINVDLDISGIGFSAFYIGNGGGGTANAASIGNLINTGTITLKNRSIIAGSGHAINVIADGQAPKGAIINSGTLNLESPVYNYGGRITITNTGVLNTNSEFRSFTAINNDPGGSINFVRTAATFTNKLVTFNGLNPLAAASPGAIYSDGTNNYTVALSKYSDTFLTTNIISSASTASISTTSGTLNKISGSGDANLPYTATAAVVGPPAVDAIPSFSESKVNGALTTGTSNSGTINTDTGSNLNIISGVTTTSTSVIAPGGSAGKGIVDFAKATATVTGTLRLQVTGNSTAGVDFDQVTNTVAAGTFNIAGATLDVTGITGTATPVDIITTNAGTITGPFATVTGLTAGWKVDYTTPGKVQLIYDSGYVAPSVDYVWDGSASTAWTTAANWTPTGLPDQNSDVTIPLVVTNQPTISTDASIKSLTIDSGATLTVTGPNLTVKEAIINNGTMTLASNSNLVQVDNVSNSGNITVNRNSNALSRLDYTLWSSPVTNIVPQFLSAFSPATDVTRFYTYNEGTNLYNSVDPTATPFATAIGYLIRMPNDAVTVPATQTFAGIFTGVPNNGDIPKTLLNTASGYNAIGNPYPSTINAEAFINANTSQIESSLYFWRKINAASGTAYAVYNPLGSTRTASSALPNGIIQVGQGFFVKAKALATSVSFTNALRLTNNQNQFFKTKATQKDRLWLNLTSTAGAFSQALIGYTADATLAVDMYDAKFINDSPIALTSSINSDEYTIQGRPTFDASDVVALNFKTDAAGDYKIALDQFDGVFATGQDVYLVDSKTGVETDLKAGSYNFTADAGIDNARFSLKYQKTLKVDAPAFNDNSISVYADNGSLFVNSKSAAISNVTVYDVQGRIIAQKGNVKSTTAVINNLRANNQVLIVKIEGEDNSVVTKKLLN